MTLNIFKHYAVRGTVGFGSGFGFGNHAIRSIAPKPSGLSFFGNRFGAPRYRHTLSSGKVFRFGLIYS